MNTWTFLRSAIPGHDAPEVVGQQGTLWMQIKDDEPDERYRRELWWLTPSDVMGRGLGDTLREELAVETTDGGSKVTLIEREIAAEQGASTEVGDDTPAEPDFRPTMSGGHGQGWRWEYVQDKCQACGGSGHAASESVPCDECHGQARQWLVVIDNKPEVQAHDVVDGKAYPRLVQAIVPAPIFVAAAAGLAQR